LNTKEQGEKFQKTMAIYSREDAPSEAENYGIGQIFRDFK